jgi:hypothetical protein
MGARHARLSRQGARIIGMLKPYPWDERADVVRVEGALVTWTPEYDSTLLAQAQAPGFPRDDLRAIRAAIPAHSSGRGRSRDPENPYRLEDLHAADRRAGDRWQAITRYGHTPSAAQLAEHRRLVAERQHISETLAQQRVGGTMGTFRRRRTWSLLRPRSRANRRVGR